VSVFVNRQNPRQLLAPAVFLFLYYLTIAVQLVILFTLLFQLALIWYVVSLFISNLVLLGLSLYMAEQVRRAGAAQ
jgi:hypothetical protein